MKFESSSLELTTSDHEKEAQTVPRGKLSIQLLYNILITTCGGTFIVGWHIGSFNTPTDVLKQFINETYQARDPANGPMTEDQFTTVWALGNGLMPLGGALGGLITGQVVQRLGHKKAMLLMNIIALISSALFLSAKYVKSYEVLIAGKLLTGFVSGYFCGVCPLYLNELSPVNLRGQVGAVNAVAICLGNVFANVLGLPQLLGTSTLWPFLLSVVPVLASLVHWFGVPFCVDSPKFLYVTKDEPEKAKQVLETLQGVRRRKNNHDHDEIDDLKKMSTTNEAVKYELEQLKAEKESQEATGQETSFASLWTNPRLRRAMTVSIVLQASQQFSGIIAVITYSTIIFQSIGLDAKTWAIYAAISISVIETICHLFVVFVIDLAGRRVLLLTGMIGMSVSCFALAAIQILIDTQLWMKVAAVCVVTVYIIFYSFGPGPIPLLVTAEFFDTESRGKATSVAVFLNWFFNFLITVSFPYIQRYVGAYSFIIYGIFLILFATFTYFKCPETKNKSTPEILKFFE